MSAGANYGPKPWLQAHWDLRAAANFILGGTGSGLLVAAALAAQPGWRWPLAAGMALIAAGLGAVWLEIGRKLRAFNVLFNPHTSWMTREAYAALLVFALGMSALVLGQAALAQAAALAALAFVFCQGRILFAAKGIPAWRARGVVALIVATALAEGGGLLVTLAACASGPPATPWLVAFALALVARAAAWSRYRARFAPGAGSAALEASGRVLVYAGTAAPLALLAIGLMLTRIASGADILAGLAALAAGWRLKFVLIRRAAHNQGFSLPQFPVRGQPSNH
jgi:phenylacetyl-CoA:acceptor oxidoreductase 26-kDa subunit